MRRWLTVLGTLTVSLPPLAALLLHACGYTARIEVVRSFYRETQFVAANKCGTDANTIDLLYLLLTGDDQLMTDTDPLLAQRVDGGASPVSVQFPEAFSVARILGPCAASPMPACAGGGTCVDGFCQMSESVTVEPTVASTRFVQVTRKGTGRAVALLMDNSSSLNGDDENGGPRFNVTDPGDRRISGAQDFVSNVKAFSEADRFTVIAYHGDGTDGVFPKLRSRDDEPPSASWFVSQREELKSQIATLKNEENGKTPLFDAIKVGVAALRSITGSAQRVVVNFSDGPSNSSVATLDEAQTALTDARYPFISVAVSPKLGAGVDQLQQLACLTAPDGKPQGALVVSSPGPELRDKFVQLAYLVTGHWRTTLTLAPRNGSLTAGTTYKLTGRMFADPGAAPKRCDETQNPTCPASMECENGAGEFQGRCFVRVKFNYKP